MQVLHGRREVGILGVEPVGSYAVRLQFDDLHGAGIYTWPYLRQLCREKWPRMRAYLQALRARGLSRDPRALSARKAHGARAPPPH